MIAGRALEAIRGGMSVQRAATQFGIPSGTLYGRCKREGIELVHKVHTHFCRSQIESNQLIPCIYTFINFRVTAEIDLGRIRI